jgi:hypothetical protein
MTPLIVVSFVLSLVVVDHRNRARRVSAANNNDSSWTASLRNWLDPEPYQDPSDSTWGHSANPVDDKHGKDSDVPQPERKRWFTRKKHRKMAKLQLTDALEMRGSVMIFVLGFFVAGVLAVAWAVKRVFGFGA